MEVQAKLEPPDDIFDGALYFYPTGLIPEIPENIVGPTPRPSSIIPKTELKYDSGKVLQEHDYSVTKEPKNRAPPESVEDGELEDFYIPISDLFLEDGVEDCPNCGTMFCNMERMIEHLLQDHQQHERIFKCQDCFSYFPRVKVLTHLHYNHNGQFRKYPTFIDVPKFLDKVLCIFCSAKFLKADELAAHLNTMHNPDLNGSNGSKSTKTTTSHCKKQCEAKLPSKSALRETLKSGKPVLLKNVRKVQWLQTVQVRNRLVSSQLDQHAI